jgi:Spy/CpxP family protein refolding chaperone
VKRLLIIALGAIAIATTSGAQELPPGKWWHRPEVAKRLDITAQQREKLDAVFRDAATELIDLKADVDKLQIAMRSELAKTQLNRQEIANVAARFNEARGRLFSREVMMLVDMRGVLTDSQWTRLRDELENRRERMRDERGQGRPNGAPMHPPMDGRRPMDGGRRPPMRQP